MRRAAGMIVCDLDGTLLTSDGSVTARTVAAVAAVRQAGWLFVIATGRPVRDTRPVVKDLEHRRPAICGSGTVVYDFEAEMILEQALISPAAVSDLLEGLRSVHPAVTFGVEQGLDFIHEPGFLLERQLFAPGTVVPRVSDALGPSGCSKVTVQLTGDAALYLADLAADLPNGYRMAALSPDFCEITRAGVTKATAADRLARRWGIRPEHVVAFGDTENDVPLFDWAGHGVAVANAEPAVLRVADEIIGSNDNDGVAHRLEQLAVAP